MDEPVDQGRGPDLDILALLDESELMQTVDLFAPQRRLEGEHGPV